MSTKDAVLAAARQLLVREDFKHLSLDDVAQKAAVAKGTIFLHFKNKEDLLSSVVENIIKDMGDDLDPLLQSKQAGIPLLKNVIATLLKTMGKNRDFLSQLGSLRKDLPPAHRESLCRGFQKNREKLEELLQRVFSRRPSAPLAIYLIGLCRSVLFIERITDKPKSLERSVQEIADFFLHGAGGAGHKR